MGIRAICTVLASLAVLAVVSEAQAQLFGERSIGGSSVTRRSRPGDTQAGTVTGSERFLRDNREDGNFIGADSRDTRAFVGAQQATTGAAAGRSGLATPPVGCCLFAAAIISNESMEKISITILPFLAANVCVVLLVTYFPSVSMFIPSLFQ